MSVDETPRDVGDDEEIVVQRRLADIESRNQRVEAEKAWEISWLRRLLIALFTYTVVFAYSTAIGVQTPYLTAFVPTTGFLLSTLTFGGSSGFGGVYQFSVSAGTSPRRAQRRSSLEV